MTLSAPSVQTSGWIEKIYEELAPTHGRYAGALRTAIAATIAAFILLALQAPMIPPGLYLIFLVSYDVPYLTFRTSMIQLASQCAGVAAALLLVAVTGNDPMARVLGITFFTFISAFLMRASTRWPLAMNFGIFSSFVLSLWESHLPAERLVHLSMWPIATGAVAVGCKVVIEYLFTRRDPRHALQREMEARVEALKQLFHLFAVNAPEEELNPAIVAVSRYALSGQGKMRSLLEEIRNHPSGEMSSFAISPALISTITRLLDLAAAFVRQNPAIESRPNFQRERFERLANALAAIQSGRTEEIESPLEGTTEATAGLLTQIERTVSNIGAMTQADHLLSDERQSTAFSNKRRDSWLRQDAWSNPAYLIYAAKLSLCATICYVIYNALAWPGISTATLTVLIAGLSSTGATNQKMLFRIAGSVIGGIIFGIGCVIFVFPYADTAIPFLLSIAIVSFIGAWVARSAHFGYVGLQIVFSFFLIAFEGFAAPTQMTPPRDRVIGIMLALVVMWIIFHQLHPERTVDKMRHGLAELLGIESEILSLIHSGKPDRVAALREEADQIVGTVRALAETIPYELDEHVERDMEISERIQDAIVSAGGLFLHVVSGRTQESESSAWPAFIETTYAGMQNGLRNLSEMLKGGAGKLDTREGFTAHPALDGEQPYPEFIQHALAFYADLQKQCREIQAEA